MQEIYCSEQQIPRPKNKKEKGYTIQARKRSIGKNYNSKPKGIDSIQNKTQANR